MASKVANGFSGKNPSVFIGCSSEYKDAARALQSLFVKRRLANSAVVEVEIWDQGTFCPSETTLSSLIEAAKKFDFAILIFGKDSISTDRGVVHDAPRDNVLFECGLFVGAIGIERTFIVTHGCVKIPSDLAGLNVVNYTDPTSTTLSAALESAVTLIFKKIEVVYISQPVIPSRLKISDHYSAWWDRHNSSRSSNEIIQTIDGLEIKVSPNTFSPNPRLTYSPIVAYKQLPKDMKGMKVLDLGTGSGVLAISAALRGADKVIAVDKEHSAVEDARYNVGQLISQGRVKEGVIEVVESDLFSNVSDRFDYILANLPIYSEARSWHGLGDSVEDIIRRCVAGLDRHLYKKGKAIFAWASFGPPNLIPELLKDHGFQCRQYTEETFGAEWYAFVAKKK